jgi:enoyl-CoA hydratase/carnithine racemase
MGGGVGASIHGKYRIATDNTLFAMPETAIGLFPDVGSTYFLPRLKNGFGLYLGLTGSRLTSYDLLYSGIATHFINQSLLEKLENSLISTDLSIPNYEDKIKEILDDFQSQSNVPNASKSLLHKHEHLIRYIQRVIHQSLIFNDYATFRSCFLGPSSSKNSEVPHNVTMEKIIDLLTEAESSVKFNEEEKFWIKKTLSEVYV